jgi:hypothetical protein
MVQSVCPFCGGESGNMKMRFGLLVAQVCRAHLLRVLMQRQNLFKNFYCGLAKWKGTWLIPRIFAGSIPAPATSRTEGGCPKPHLLLVAQLDRALVS